MEQIQKLKEQIKLLEQQELEKKIKKEKNDIEYNLEIVNKIISNRLKSTVTYRHNQSYNFKKDGVKHVVKEDLIDGERGLSFIFLKKGDSKFFSITVREDSKDNFSVKIKDGDKSSESNIDMLGLLQIIKGNSELAFVNKYLTNEQRYI